MDQDFGVNQGLVEELYLRYCENPSAVDPSWRNYFEELAEPMRSKTVPGTAPAIRVGVPDGIAPTSANGNGHTNGNVFAKTSIVPFSERTSSVIASIPPDAEVVPGWDGHRLRSVPPPSMPSEANLLQGRVSALINAYRVRGHLFAQLDPLNLLQTPPPELDLAGYGLDNVSAETVFSTGDLAGPEELPLAEIVARLQETYCRSIGAEFTFIESPEERTWLQQRMESTLNRTALSRDEQIRILTKLSDAEIFENFLHTNFVGAKRFSLEGGESVIPLIDLLIDYSARDGVEEIVMGMAHRGRLNVLSNILGKNPKELFAAFDDRHPELHMGRGDVKYHLGYSSDRITSTGNKIHLTLAFNPSHLEFVNPVVEGRVRAKQDRHQDSVERKRVLPLLIHGDAAFIGQGVVPETLNLSLLRGYTTGGTIHLVINNQIGFTTNVDDSRSTRYSTDITRMLRCPVFHVNGEDPEAVVQVARLATEYRQKFGKDVCIDMYCYRKYGHNEADEPRFTQPVMYAAIDAKPTVRQMYVKKLVAMSSIDETVGNQIASERKGILEKALREARESDFIPKPYAMGGVWQGYSGGSDADVPESETRVSKETLVSLIDKITTIPAGFNINPKVQSTVLEKRKKAAEGAPMDWGAGEHLAYASLVASGTRVRITGQDARRGTFSHRHAVVFDTKTGKTFTPLAHVSDSQATFEIWDSPLSEQGVLGFEYGYSLDSPDALVIWEAQFGDFANGAQVFIDQFISSCEDKWSRLSGLVLLLPHGFEGQGPEHSSARLERFMSLAAEDNIQVQNLTSAAQIFHSLRRQVLRPWRKPLVIMTPKSLLRAPEASSTLDELATGSFQRIIPDTSGTDPKKVRRVVLCSGKVYYDLAKARKEKNISDVHIIRLEQLYPLRASELNAVLAPYGKKTELVWVQEEPYNMGAFYTLNAMLPNLIGRSIRGIARAESASPATGSLASHKLEQQALIEETFKA